MFGKIIYKLTSFAFLTFLLINIFSIGATSANAVSISERLRGVADTAQYDTSEDGENSALVAGRFIAIFLSLLGVIFVLLAFSAGYSWMTAEGNAEKVEQAKKTLTQAIIGLAIILAAYVITVFIVDSISTDYIKPDLIGQ